jgi:5'-deoxynucleotidase YfbR-like HD superfamily hydrolase
VTVGPPVDDFDEPRHNMRTVSGRYLDVLDPNPELIELGDIAHALARVCRFGGMTKTVYTVGEHSIHVADQLWRTHGDLRLAAAGLMHDAAEAYLGDVIAPLKRCLDDYEAIEARWARAIGDRFKLDLDDLDPRIKEADTGAYTWETVMFRDCTFRPAPDPADIARTFVERALTYGISPRPWR